MRAHLRSQHTSLAFPAMLGDDVIAQQIGALGGNGRVTVMIKMTMRVSPMVKMRGSRVAQMLSCWRISSQAVSRTQALMESEVSLNISRQEDHDLQ
ncbi:hypothetical protein TNCT_421621 [Trichonephila clavata]|uniref:Uncharacterized protein n=1 Tax=Trichonephila clavata TaxID=2740835 RepID=A0A8X6JB68_TRICU|nr:hypothetical protein TNCT_421621 [Trichonephila clavata]